MIAAPRIEAFGDAAILIILGDAIDDVLNERVHRLARTLDRLHTDDPRFGAPVPAYASVLVPVDPIDPGVDAAIEHVRTLLGTGEPATEQGPDEGPLIEIPTRYGGADGPDIEDVASRNSLRQHDVVDLHSSVEYRVHFLGFAPGFAYLAHVPAAISIPRLATPRVRVPSGSVAIAGEQTAVFPVDAPSGWRLIGRTDLRVWDLATDPPALLLPGTRVRFVPVRD